MADALTHADYDPPRAPLLRAVPPPSRKRADAGDGLDVAALADMVAAPSTGVAQYARAALAPVLQHDALVLVTPALAGAPVQIAAPRGLHGPLAEIEWSRIVSASGAPDNGTAVRIALNDVLDGLSTAAWSASSGGCPVWLVICGQSRLEIDDTEESAARQVAMLAAARARRIDDDPPAGTLAFSRAMSLERERVRAQISSSHAATLSRVADGTAGGRRSDQPRIACAARPGDYDRAPRPVRPRGPEQGVR
jgi:hypothetical protein